MIMPRVVLGKAKSQHVMDGLWSNEYEDRRLCRGSCQAKEKYLVYNRRLRQGLPLSKSSSMQRTDSDLRAMNMDNNVEGRTRQKKSPNMQQTSYGPKVAKTDGYAKGHARNVLTRSGQTLVMRSKVLDKVRDHVESWGVTEKLFVGGRSRNL